MGIAADVAKPIQLLPAEDLSSFYVWTRRHGINSDPKSVFTLTNGMLRISGEEQGLLATQADFSNYRLLAEYKWGGGAGVHDSGIFVHAARMEKPLSGFLLKFKCELVSGGKDVSGQTFLMGNAQLRVGGQIKTGNTRLPTLQDANPERPPGEWNTMEILCDEGRLEVKVNGHLMVKGADATPRSGQILLQSMTNEIFFRRLKLTPVK
jgi:hypothetical protein